MSTTMLPTRFLASALCAALLPLPADCVAQATPDLKSAALEIRAVAVYLSGQI